MLYGRRYIEIVVRDGIETRLVTDEYSVKVENEQDIIAEFLRLLAEVKQPGLFNPQFKMITNRKTGQVDRVLKSYTHYD